MRVGLLAEAAISPAALARFSAVVATSAPRAALIEWNAACRAQAPAVAFIAADVLGAAGFAFSDFGPEHTVRDATGQAKQVGIVGGVKRSAPGEARTVIKCGRDDVFSSPGNGEGMFIIFREVKGMTQLNDGAPRRVLEFSFKSHSLTIEADSSSWPDYEGGGVIEEVKPSVKMAFASLAERINAPAHPAEGALYAPCPFGKFGRSEQLHAAFQAVELFRAKHDGALPPLRDTAAAAECVTLAREWVAGIAGKAGALALAPEEVTAEVVLRVAALARAELPALCAFFGGVVAQEVVKVTGKYTPLRQWLYHDAFEVLPEDFVPPPIPAVGPAAAGAAAAPASAGGGALLPMSAEFAPAGSRYDHHFAILGRSLQARIMSQRVFLVGAGALGCEMLKNFALMGVGCGAGGRVVVTDMDRIELSNLNRQFLFREKDIGRPKSLTASAAAKAMNADLNVSAMEARVGTDTEATFNDAFWGSVDLVTNALDNVKARRYVDGRCVLYGLPLMESGTLGVEANVQAVLPGLTAAYSDTIDPDPKGIAMCTLKNFPFLIEHCIEWARAVFGDAFTARLLEASEFVASPSAWLAKAEAEKAIEVAKAKERAAAKPVSASAGLSKYRAKLEGVVKSLEISRSASLETCLAAARELFNEKYVINIKQLIHNFPADHKDNDGNVFWGGGEGKRFPTAAAFDASDPLHLGFVIETAALLADTVQLKLPAGWDAPDALAPLLAAIRVPEFVPENVAIKAGEHDVTEEGREDDAAVCEVLTARLRALGEGEGAAERLSAYRFAPAEFEKDDDTNHHVAFISAAANLRARNYNIREASHFEVKMVAGRIIPAVATTTCAITGLVCVELYKTVARCRLEHFFNAQVDLGTNRFFLDTPAEPARIRSKAAYVDKKTGNAVDAVRAIPEGFSKWDFLEVREGSLTCAQLVEWFKARHGVNLDCLLADASPRNGLPDPSDDQPNKVTSYQQTMFMAFSMSKERAATRLVDLYRQLAPGLPCTDPKFVGVPALYDIPSGRNFLLFQASCSDDDGVDVLVPTVKFFFSEF